MVDETYTPDEVETEDTPERAGPATFLKWLGIVLLGLAVLVLILIFAIDTNPGRRFVVSQINGLELESGLDVEIDRIDGSLYGEMTVRDLSLADPQGVFMTIPEATVDWHPFDFIGSHLNVESLNVPQATLTRLPVLNETESDPDAPLLPEFDIDVDQLNLGRLDIGEAVTGQRHALTLNGEVHIADGRAQIDADVRALEGESIAGGDRIALVLDAVPDDDRLDVSLDVAAPADGLVAGLTGIAEPLTAKLSGDGSWASWDGDLNARSGSADLAALALSARDGTFRIKGPVKLAAIMEGPAVRMTSPQLDIDLTAAFSEAQVADIDLALRSSAFALDAAGGIDLTESSVSDFNVQAQLLEPGAITEGVAGRAIRANIKADGAFTAPTFSYAVTAEAIGFGDILVEDLNASGNGSSVDGTMTVPLNMTASRVSGLNDAVGGLLTNLKANGTFLIADGRLATDDLKFTSDRIDATAVIVADLESGTYTGGIQGAVNDYEVAGLGLVDVRTDIELVTAPGGGFGLRGPLRVQTRRIDNESIRDFLGGNAVITANLVAPGDGVYGVDNLRLKAPGASAQGTARYNPDGQFAARLTGTSNAYGPFAVQANGTADAPVIRIRAKRPLMFTDVDAVIRGTPAGYDVKAKGGTAYGPFNADLLVATGDQLVIDIRRATLADITASGRLRQAAAGPFVGDLRLSGNGVNGVASLQARGRVQAAEIDARIRGLSLAGETPIGIRRADIDMLVLLPDSGPAINGTAQIGSLTYGSFRIQKARAEFDVDGDMNGTAKIVATGRAPTPYDIALNARLSPNAIVAALKGEVARQPLRTVRPARIAIENGTYRLAPTTVRFREGDVKLAGSFGDGIQFQSRFDKFDLGIVNAFAPAGGFGGAATGSVDFSQSSGTAFPEADMRLQLDDFTRSGAVAVSQPVDIELAARLDADGGNANAVMRERGRQVGRMKIALTPLSRTAGTWSERLMRSPLSGGLRYNGPASALFSFAGLEGQSLNGTLAIAADVSGAVSEPQLRGVLKANSLIYENEVFGTRVAGIALDGRFTNTDFILTRADGKAGDGTVSATGNASLSAAAGYPIDMKIRMDDAQLADAEGISARVSGNLNIVNGPGTRPMISGTLNLPEARYKIVQSGAVEISELEGVRRKPAKLRDPDDIVEEDAEIPSDWGLDIDIRANNRIFVTGMGLESEWSLDMNVGGRLSQYRVNGTVDLVRGEFNFANQKFELQKGLIEMTGEREINPRLDIVAETEVDTITALINIGGRAYDPQISFSSRPARPQDEILSLILFGGPPSELGALEAVQLAAALNNLRGSGGGGLNPLGKIQSATGFDRLKILGADEGTGRGTALAVGQYLADDVYVEVITDTRGFTATQIEIALTKALSVLSSVSTQGGQGVNLRYSKDY
ncbi:MAG: translocation/assembly module TamB domain-containing protein [Pacificimonas sp.]